MVASIPRSVLRAARRRLALGELYQVGQAKRLVLPCLLFADVAFDGPTRARPAARAWTDQGRQAHGHRELDRQPPRNAPRHLDEPVLPQRLTRPGEEAPDDAPFLDPARLDHLFGELLVEERRLRRRRV